MPLCTQNTVSGPLADVLDWKRIEKCHFCPHLQPRSPFFLSTDSTPAAVNHSHPPLPKQPAAELPAAAHTRGGARPRWNWPAAAPAREVELAPRRRPRTRPTLRRTWLPHPLGATLRRELIGAEGGGRGGVRRGGAREQPPSPASQICGLRCATFRSSPPGPSTPRRLHPPPLLVAIHGPYGRKSKIPGRQPATDPSSSAAV
jgi:hypothetical protein